jgi:hypothetical protein
MDVKYIAEYYYKKLYINIIQKISEWRKSTEFKNMKHVSDEELSSSKVSSSSLDIGGECLPDTEIFTCFLNFYDS